MITEEEQEKQRRKESQEKMRQEIAEAEMINRAKQTPAI